MTGNDRLAAKAELIARIATIDWRAGPARLLPEIERIRALAQHHRLPAAVDVATRLHVTLARGDRDVPVRRWLALLSEAVSTDAGLRAAA